MWFLYRCLLVPSVSLSATIPAIDTGLGPLKYGPEGLIDSFALLTDDNLGNLPATFTICSSIAAKAFTGGIHPFQLNHNDGKTWIAVHFYPTTKMMKFHRLHVRVSNISVNYILISRKSHLDRNMVRSIRATRSISS